MKKKNCDKLLLTSLIHSLLQGPLLMKHVPFRNINLEIEFLLYYQESFQRIFPHKTFSHFGILQTQTLVCF